MTPLSGGADDLPPLPEPFRLVRINHDPDYPLDQRVYSAEQMRAYVESDRARRQGALTEATQALMKLLRANPGIPFGDLAMHVPHAFKAVDDALAALSLKGA